MSNLKSWSLGTVEFGKYVSSSGSKVLLWIGKTMPLMKMGKPKVIQVGLNKSCLINDPKCRPTVATQVRSANYTAVPTSGGRGMSGKYGDKVRLEVRNHSVDQMTATSIER